MTHTLIWLGGISIAELLLWTPLWRWRKILACLLIPGLSVTSGLLFGIHPEVWTGLILALSIYRLVNLLRVLEGRLQPNYLFRATQRTSWWLIGLQISVVVLARLNHAQPQSTTHWLYGISIVQLAGALVLFASTRRHLRTTRPPSSKKSYTDSELPTLSVAIPARNETDDLEACLQSLIASDYPKLEILVLDDCSQNKRTPEIIRGYAHDGVRFISGRVPSAHWLAKNYAYEQLADAANGELLLFCGVDTRFQPGSLRGMVEALLVKNKQMVSFIPRNNYPSAWRLDSLMVQPSRYAWELALPRRLFKRPPVLSTCWLIRSSTLRAAGSFEAISNSISIESYFARYAAQHNDSYAFLQSNAAIQLTSAKSLSEQRATAVRTRYPQLHRRPELVGLLSITELLILVVPFGLVMSAIVMRDWLLIILSLLSCILLIIFYARIVAVTYRKFLVRSVWLLPFAAIYDICLLHYSMWQYEFREVIWKDRNVCIPLLQAVPHLPHTDLKKAVTRDLG